MKKNKWYSWLIYAGIWIIAGIINHFVGRENYFIFQIVIFLLLAPCQYICDKYGEKGSRFFKYICIGVLFLCVAYSLITIYGVLH